MCRNKEEKAEKNKSELKKLLEKNARGSGLTTEEYQRAKFLINNPEHAKEDCWICKISTSYDIKKAIFDTGFCQVHANYTLLIRK